MEKYILLFALWIGCLQLGYSTTETNCSACQLILAQKDNISCNGRADGLLKVAPFNCKGKVSYLWSNGAKTSEIKNLSPGKYAVVVTDEDGSKANGSWEITEPAKLTVAGSKLDPLCYGDATGTIYPNVNGGTPMYTFKWSSGQTVQYINSLKSGNYTLTVTDDNGCTAVKSWTIKDPEKVRVNLEYQDDVLCNGGSDGEIKVDGDGGTGKYTYQWSNGSTSSKLTNLKAGVYTVTVYDEYLCEGTASYTINEPSSLGIKLIQQVDVSCAGKADGRLEVDGVGGTPGYNFSWSNGSKSSKITNLSPGTFEVTVTDKNGCKFLEKYKITEPAKLEVSLKSRKHNLCFGDKQGEIEVTPKGGTPPYLYNWSNGSNTAHITGLSAGNYELTLVDNNLCEIKVTYSITEPTELNVSMVAVQNVDCFGGKTGSIEVEGKGGTPPYSYHWSNGATTAIIKNLSAGTYNVTIMDVNNCEVKETYKVTEPDQLISQLISKIDNSCHGDKKGELEVEGSGGTPPYSYTWSTGETSRKLSGLSAGNYEVTIIDDNKCDITVSYEILEPTALGVELLLLDDILCFGEKSGLLGVTGRGGTPDYGYQWSNGEKTGLIDMLTAGTYSVTVEDKNGCTEFASYTLSQPDSLKLEVLRLTHNSCGATNIGEIEVELSGGNPPYTYLWSTGARGSRISNLTSGTYSVEAKDDNGCVVTQTFEIKMTDDLLPSKEIVRNVKCHGGKDGSIRLEMGGGTGPYTFLWSTGATNSSIVNLSSGGYTVTVQDKNGCTYDQTYMINEPAALEIVEQEIKNIKCHSDTSGFISIDAIGGTGTRYVKWTYRSANEQNFNTIYDGLLIKYDTLDNLAAGFYALELRDDNDCTISDTFEILEPTKIEQQSIELNDLRCHGEQSGNLKVQLKGGTGIYFIEWTYRPAGETMGNLYSQRDMTVGDTLNGLFAGTYFLTATDTNDCVYIDSFIINEPETIKFEELVKTDLLCHGDSSGSVSIKIEGGTSPFSIEWTYRTQNGPLTFKNSNNVTEDQVTNLNGGMIGMNILDENKCALIDSVEIIEPDAIVRMGGLIQPPLCHGDSSGKLIVEYIGGTNINLIEWTYRPDPNSGFSPYQMTQNQVTDSIVNAPGGEYRILVYDENNCVNESIIPLDEPEKVEYLVEEIVPSHGNDGEIHIESAGGWGFYEYNWSGPGGFASTDEDIIDLIPGEYQCVIVDAVKCELITEWINVPLSTWTKSPLSTISKVYPVPAHSFIQVDFEFPSPNRFGYLMSMEGVLLEEVRVNQINNRLDIHALPRGNYLLLVKDGIKKYAQRISKL